MKKEERHTRQYVEDGCEIEEEEQLAFVGVKDEKECNQQLSSKREPGDC
eukprot:XP_001704168.1 Hypothetical protein GL50803_39748 [Giardia lamblia ATCC 50803]